MIKWLLRKLQQLGYDVEVINYIKKLSLREKISIGINQLRVQGVKKFLMRFSPSVNNENYVRGIRLRTKVVDQINFERNF